MKYVEKVLTAVLVTLSTVSARTADGQEAVIHSFGGADGSEPRVGLLMDAKGDIFGITAGGGTYGNGTVFELNPVAGGGWKYTVLHDFNYADGFSDGSLVLDKKGNLYGTTRFANGDYFQGTVFELSSTTGGSWSETTIHSFPSSATDGTVPDGGLAFDAQGNLYGNTAFGGSNERSGNAYSGGTVFELTPSAGGTWTEKILYNFGAMDYENEGTPGPGVAVDSAGDVYGANFELIRESDGSWMEKSLYVFGSSATLLSDGKGNFYGTIDAFLGGNFGSIFELSPSAEGPFTITKSFDFTEGVQGVYPQGPLTTDAEGDLYGATTLGGTNDPQGGEEYLSGTVFKLTPQADGSWKDTVLHSFPGSTYDGFEPYAGVILDHNGNLYGTTAYGGANGQGTVFEIEPNVTPVGTTTTLVANPSTSLMAGEPITLTATVTPASGSAIPTGVVIFTDPAFPGPSATVPLNAGVAVYRGKVPPVGTYSVLAIYTGAPAFVGSNSATITTTVTAPSPH